MGDECERLTPLENFDQQLDWLGSGVYIIKVQVKQQTASFWFSVDNVAMMNIESQILEFFSKKNLHLTGTNNLS